MLTRYIMGNTQTQQIKLSTIMNHLDKTERNSPKSRTRTIATNDTNTPYKVVIRIGDQHDDIIKNISIPDAGFKNVILTIGTQLFNGHLGADKRWYILEPIPLFKIPTEHCNVTIYTLNDVEPTTINLQYDSYGQMPDLLKLEWLNVPLVTERLLYNGGCVY